MWEIIMANIVDILARRLNVRDRREFLGAFVVESW